MLIAPWSVIGATARTGCRLIQLYLGLCALIMPGERQNKEEVEEEARGSRLIQFCTFDCRCRDLCCSVHHRLSKRLTNIVTVIEMVDLQPGQDVISWLLRIKQLQSCEAEEED